MSQALPGAARHLRWSDLPQDRPMPLIDRRRIIGDKLMVSEVHLHKGFVVPSHHHEIEQFVVVVSGRCRFGLGAEGSKDHRRIEVQGGDVLVLPSHWEGLPYLLQEALHHGAPVIASDVAGNRAALADGAYGLLFRCGDVAALAKALEAALGDLDGLRAKAEMGRAPLAQRFGAQPFWRALSTALAIGAK